MGTYTDFFIAEPEELRRAFVGWRLPSPNPVTRPVMNPFTNKAQDTVTWVADPADDLRVEPLPGATLGQRLSRFPHVALKNLDPLMLSELVTLMIGGTSTEWLARVGNPPPLVNVEDTKTAHLFFWEVPRSVVDALAKVDPAESVAVGAKWSERAMADWSADDCAAVLRDLGALARQALQAGKRLYYWV